MRPEIRAAFLCAALAAALPASQTAKAASLSDASLSGTYSLRFYGRDFANFPKGVNNEIAGIGLFEADGKGGITGGALSYNDGGQVCTNIIASGTYEVLGDGEGTLSLKASPQTATCPLTDAFGFNIVLGKIDARTGIAAGMELSSSFFTLASGVSTFEVPVSGIATRR